MDFIVFLVTEPAEMIAGGDWIGIVLGLIMYAAEAILVIMLLAFLYRAADSWFQPVRTGSGKVVSKGHVEAFTTTNTVVVNNVPTVQVIYHPERWVVEFEVGGLGTDTLDFDERGWKGIKVGDSMTVEYVTGRMSGGLYLRGTR